MPEDSFDDALRLRHAEAVLTRLKAGDVPIYTMDIETDPFERGKTPVPFVIGFYDGLSFWHFKTDKHSTCIEKMKVFLEDETVDPGIVYMHNGGRFDFFYMLDWFEGKANFVNSRIISAKMPILPASNPNRYHRTKCFEFRDSYAIMPFPLAAYQKDKIEISWLSRELRDAHMGEIISYLRGDCVYLWDLCLGFLNEFGEHKTIASAAFTELGKFHKYEAMPWRTDKELREKYYYGGRVQCFQKGIVEQPLKIYDVNSMYPFVMSEMLHPVSWPVSQDRQVHGWNEDGSPSKEKLKTFFLTVEGENYGAFPVVTSVRGQRKISFELPYGVFCVTIHEFLAAMRLKRFFLTKIVDTENFLDYSRFHLFVDHFYRLRQTAKETGDKMRTLFYKLILNSAYGKFGINPANYFNWQITKVEDDRPKGDGWTLDTITQGRFFIWKQPSQLFWNVKNIATAASITGAARSILLTAIAKSKKVVYCDTDSIICESLGDDIALHDTKLGAWKLEATGVEAAIVGRKTYAVFDSGGECVKHACKGVVIDPDEIRRAAKGEPIFAFRDAPTFKRDGSAMFITRTVRMT